jgi:aspartyl/asparaginyl beta-hydroxylase (cupin superfamily)
MTAMTVAAAPAALASAAALVRQAEAAVQQRDPARALALLRQAEAHGPPTVELHMARALALRVTGDLVGAIAALDAALALEPYTFLALLSKGALLEQLNQRKAAAAVYANALKLAPLEPPPGLQPPLARARAAVQANADALHAHLAAAVAGSREARAGEPLARFDEALAIFAGRAKPYPQEPLLLHYPRLPAIPFHDRAHFPWLAELEAATPVIQSELAAVLDAGFGGYQPYIAYPPGAPVNQWGELNHSRRWSSYFLWRDGARQDAACEECPRTAALLDTLPLQRQPGFAPTAMFSALEAGAHIPPHTGSANTRLLVHLPLIVPGPARFRVGAETREWRVGEAWVFDDTIEHEAWNDADALRVILILDIWTPLLSQAERELVTAMMAAKNAWQATG